MTASKLVALALAGVLFPALTLAQQASSAAEPTQQSMNIEQFDQEMAKAQENLKKMQDQMSLIHKTTDPVQRQKLMQDHQAMMQQGMLMMKGMMGCCGGMMGGRMTDMRGMMRQGMAWTINGVATGGHVMEPIFELEKQWKKKQGYIS